MKAGKRLLLAVWEALQFGRGLGGIYPNHRVEPSNAGVCHGGTARDAGGSVFTQ